MVGETAENSNKLCEAALKGDETTFQQLLTQDPFLLEQVSFACSNRTPLHVATLQGNAGIVADILQRNPQLSRELDLQGSSPLHIAAAQGYVEIASALLSAAPSMCWSRDCHGMNPVHVAAMNGHVEILKILIDQDPFPAMEKLDRGQSVLQLCVKRRRIEALKCLVEKVSEVVYAEDDDGETVLHSAVRFNQLEVMRLLADKRLIEKLSTKNSKGKTVVQISRESSTQDTASLEIERILSHRITSPEETVSFLGKMSDNTMVVVVLIATMAFQAAVSPPGGVWQGDNSSLPPHRVGEAVMASHRPKVFRSFKQANVVAFASSLVAIFLLTTGLPSRHVVFTSAVVYAMWVSMGSIAISYGVSVAVITPGMEADSLRGVIRTVFVVSIALFGLLCLAVLLLQLPPWLVARSYEARPSVPNSVFIFHSTRVSSLRRIRTRNIRSKALIHIHIAIANLMYAKTRLFKR